jgi:ABC-2 type transport system permease protein
VQSMPGPLRDVVLLTPMGAASEALHTAGTGAFPGPAGLAVIAGWVGVLSWIATRTFRWG